MQAEVEQLQEKVNGLHSMVVVVDESNAESGKFNVLFQPHYVLINYQNVHSVNSVLWNIHLLQIVSPSCCMLIIVHAF